MLTSGPHAKLKVTESW